MDQHKKRVEYLLSYTHRMHILESVVTDTHKEIKRN